MTLKTSEENANWERMGPQGPGRWSWGNGTGGSYPRVWTEPTTWDQEVPNVKGGRDGFIRRMLMDLVWKPPSPLLPAKELLMSRISFASPTQITLSHLFVRQSLLSTYHISQILGWGWGAMPRQDEALFYLELGV